MTPAHRDLTERVARAIKAVRSNATPTSELAKIAVAALAPELAVVEAAKTYDVALNNKPFFDCEKELAGLLVAIAYLRLTPVAALGNEGEPTRA